LNALQSTKDCIPFCAREGGDNNNDVTALKGHNNYCVTCCGHQASEMSKDMQHCCCCRAQRDPVSLTIRIFTLAMPSAAAAAAKSKSEI